MPSALSRANRHGSVASVYSGFGDDGEGENAVTSPISPDGRESRASQVSVYDGFDGMDVGSPGNDGGGDDANDTIHSVPETPNVWVHGTVYADKTTFYHGLIDAAEAKTRLLDEDQQLGHKPGRFLFREAAMAAALSDIPDSHVLSVLTAKDAVTHYRIERSEEGVASAPYTINEQPCGGASTLVEVVKHLSNGSTTPVLTDGILGLTVITSSDAEQVLAQRAADRRTNSPAKQPNTAGSDGNDAGAAGLMQANAEVAGFQRGNGAETPMFLPNSVAAASSAGFSVEGCIHPFATESEANGLIADSAFSGPLTLGKFVLRNPNGKSESADSCIYIIHVVTSMPPAALPNNLEGCISQHRIIAPFGDDGGIFEVSGNEIDSVGTFHELMTNVLFKWQEGWWETPLTTAVPPLTDRSKAKSIEKAQKVREKQWAKEAKKYEKSVRKSGGGRRPISGISVGSALSALSGGSAYSNSLGSPAGSRPASFAESLAGSPTSAVNMDFSIEEAAQEVWVEPPIELLASAEEWYRPEITTDELAESRLGDDKPPGAFMVRIGDLPRQFMLSVKLPKTWAKSVLHIPISYVPTEQGTTFSLQNSVLVFGSLDAVINHYNKTKAEKGQLPCKLLFAGQEPEKLIVNYKVSEVSPVTKKWPTQHIEAVMRPKTLDPQRDVVTPGPSISKEERWSAVSATFDSTVKRTVPVLMRPKKAGPTDLQLRISKMSMDGSIDGLASGLSAIPVGVKKPKQKRQPQHFVAGTATNAGTKDGPDAHATFTNAVANHVYPLAGEKRAVETRRNEAARNQMWDVRKVNEQARGAPELIGRSTAYSTDAREQKRQAAGQSLAHDVGMINEQAVGAPELVGKPTAYGTDSAQMSREQRAQQNAWRAKKVNPQITGAVSRTKQADASWGGKAPLQPGETHEVPNMPLTIEYDGRQSASPEQRREQIAATHVPSGPEDRRTRFFFDMVDKDDCVSLLKMSKTQGSFLFLPDPGFTNIKFTLLFYNKGKVSTHALFRTAPGRPFTICCVPFAMTNLLLDGSRGTDQCMTLEDVARHLSRMHEYWPFPLVSGIDAPVTDNEVDEMMAVVKDWELSELAARKKKALKSKRQVKSRLAQGAQEATAAVFTVAPRLAAKMSRANSRVDPDEDDGTDDAMHQLAAALATKPGMVELRALFDRLDSDKDGKVSAKEWGSKVGSNSVIMSKYFGGSSIADLGKVFSKIDADGDGHLTWKEFTSAVTPPSAPARLGGEGSAPPPAVIKTTAIGSKPAQSFFHGKLKKKQAERALLSGQSRPKDGTFLIRAHDKDSSEGGGPPSYIFTVATTVSGKTKPIHHIVEWKAEKNAYVLNKATEFPVSTLDALVEQLRVQRPKWTMPLTEGIVAPKKEEPKKSRKQKKQEAEEAAAVSAKSEELSALFQKLDTDGDGEVSWEEFAKGGGKTIKHEIEIVTSDIDDAGTTTPISIAMVGEGGLVGPSVVLAAKKSYHSKPLQQGRTDDFVVELPDVGSIEGVEFSYDNAVANKWHVATVSIVQHHDEGTWTERHTISCNAWVGGSNDGVARFMVPEDLDDDVYDLDSDGEADGEGGGTPVHFRKTRRGVSDAMNKRNKKMIASVRIKNVNAPGAPELVGRPTHFDTTAKEMIRLKGAQDATEKYRRVNEQVRGELAGGKTVYDHSSAEMSREMALAQTTWDVKAVNPQQLVPGIFSRDAEADAVHGTKEFQNTDYELEAQLAAGKELQGTAVFN